MAGTDKHTQSNADTAVALYEKMGEKKQTLGPVHAKQQCGPARQADAD